MAKRQVQSIIRWRLNTMSRLPDIIVTRRYSMRLGFMKWLDATLISRMAITYLQLNMQKKRRNYTLNSINPGNRSLVTAI